MLFLLKNSRHKGIKTTNRSCTEVLLIHYTSFLLKNSRIIFLLFSFLSTLQLSSPLFSQNLVPNTSFEEKINFHATDPTNWIKCLKNDTPDHFFLDASVPGSFNKNKFFGGTEPYDGNACAGIFCYRVNPLRGIGDVREYIQIQLKENLKKDSIYHISLAICIDPESNMAINNFHVFFSSLPVLEKHERKMFELRPQVTFRKNYFDNTDWIRLEEQYKARGNEKILVLGNFSSDKKVRVKKVSFKNENTLDMKWNLGEKETAAYYYIDDVVIVPQREVLKTHEEEAAPAEPGPLKRTDFTENERFEIEKIEKDSSIILENILFDFDEAVLLPGSYTELNRLYQFLEDNKGVQILIEGHTDNVGSLEYNMQLSLRRAEAVGNYLIEKGIDPSRLKWKGFGKTRPVSMNKTEEGRQMNRRVAFRIIDE